MTRCEAEAACNAAARQGAQHALRVLRRATTRRSARVLSACTAAQTRPAVRERKEAMTQHKTCARCGVKLGDWRIYSRWTHNYYCVHPNPCARRAARRARLESVLTAEQAKA